MYNLPMLPLVSYNVNPQPIPAIYSEGFSQYETVTKLMQQTNDCINAINGIITVGIDQPIRDKLEAMALSGELTDIIESAVIYDGGVF